MQNTANELSLINSASIMSSDENYNRMMNFASAMAEARVTVPEHIAGNPGDCLAVTMQALSWGMNPFLVAQKTSLVQGKLCYEAQLVSSVLTNSGVIDGRPEYEFFGNWDRIVGNVSEKTSSKGNKYFVPGWSAKDEEGLGVIVRATIKGEKAPRELRMLLKQATVRHSTNWANNPEQQLSYLAIKNWVRRNAPDVLLGVYTDDEISHQGFENAKNITPSAESASIDPKAVHAAMASKSQQQASEEPPELDDADFDMQFESELANQASADQEKIYSGMVDLIGAAETIVDLEKCGSRIIQLGSRGELHESHMTELRSLYGARLHSIRNPEGDHEA